MRSTNSEQGLTLVLGGTGKTGRRVAERLWNRGHPVRIAHRGAPVPFDWAAPDGWPATLEGVGAVYVTYHPDLTLPEAAGRVGAFARAAVGAGARRLVLLSGRGEWGAQAAEEALKASGARWTILRASWFMQNFSEGDFAPALRAGTLTLPVGDTPEPFVDADDIADVAVAALTGVGLIGRTLELTGPRLLTFRQAVAEIALAAERPLRFLSVSLDEFTADLARQGVDAEVRTLMTELFDTLFDGRNASTTGDIEDVLWRPARDFADFAMAAAASGTWEAEDVQSRAIA